MQLLQRHAWWGLLAIAVATVVSGLVDLASGVTWQAVDVTGNTSDEIAVQSSAGAELANFAVRTVGVSFIALGALVCAVLLFAYRQVRIWAWWVMWTPAGVHDRQLAADAGLRCVGAGDHGNRRGGGGSRASPRWRTAFLRAVGTFRTLETRYRRIGLTWGAATISASEVS